MKGLAKLGTVLLMFVLTLAACGGNAAPEANDSPSVRFVTPQDGDTVTSPVQVQMEATNFTIEEAGEVREGAGHFHIMVYEGCLATGEIIPAAEGFNHFGMGQTETELELEPGEYTLCLQVGDGIHAAVDLVDEITITVE